MARNPKRLPSDNFVVPSLRSVSPRYAELAAKRSELLKRHQSLSKEISTFAQEIHSKRAGDVPQNSHVEDRRKHDELIAELGDIAGELIESGLVKTPEKPSPTIHDRLRASQHEREVVERALGLLHNPIEDERKRASRQICESLRPQYQAIVNELVAAVIAVGAAVDRACAFGEACHREAIVRSTLEPVYFGSFFGPSGGLTGVLNTAIKLGYVRKADVPTDLLG